MDLMINFFDAGGLVAINTHLFTMLDRQVDADDVHPEVLVADDAVGVLRLFVRVLELGAGDAMISGRAVLDLLLANFPSLAPSIIGAEFGVAPPTSARIDYRRLCANLIQLMVRSITWKHNLHLVHNLQRVSVYIRVLD